MVETSENQIKLLLKKADKYQENGIVDEARKLYLKCISYDDGSIPKNEKELKKMEDIFLAWLSYASFLKDQNDWQAAIKAAKRAIPYPALKPYAFSVLGQCYQEINESKKAENAFRQSIKLKPRPAVWVLLYDLLYHNFVNRVEEAIDCLYSALDIDPDYEEAHYNLGCYLKQNREYDDAIEHFTKAIEIDPMYGIAYAELAFTLILAYKSQTSKQPSKEILIQAEGYLMKSIECDPLYGWSRCYLANVLWSQRKIRKAHEQYKELIKIWPDDSLSHWTIGDFLACEDINRDNAEYHLKKAIELDPENAVAHYHLGKALLKWERNSGAKIELEKASKLGHEKAIQLLSEI